MLVARIMQKGYDKTRRSHIFCAGRSRRNTNFSARMSIESRATMLLLDSDQKWISVKLRYHCIETNTSRPCLERAICWKRQEVSGMLITRKKPLGHFLFFQTRARTSPWPQQLAVSPNAKHEMTDSAGGGAGTGLPCFQRDCVTYT